MIFWNSWWRGKKVNWEGEKKLKENSRIPSDGGIGKALEEERWMKVTNVRGFVDKLLQMGEKSQEILLLTIYQNKTWLMQLSV